MVKLDSSIILSGNSIPLFKRDDVTLDVPSTGGGPARTRKIEQTINIATIKVWPVGPLGGKTCIGEVRIPGHISFSFSP